ncbi:type IX secretion system outer membrane channel protein PorV [Capnocytophaga canimorsus]|uniref:type IX secretion system outer membrane channel protein PorV n=1 Tax=Capnocytophaga canimorsus TaxID=28188 RepID=UPI0037D03E2A
MRNLFLILLYFPCIVYAQSTIHFNRSSVIQTGMPFLSLQSDARASAMANIGSVTTPDVFSQSWNSAKYAFIENKKGLGMSYVPYLNKLTNDVFLGNITYFVRPKERGTWAFSMNYFNMGDVELSQMQGINFLSNGFVKPNEFTLDVSYNLKLSEHISMGVVTRWLHSNLQNYNDNEKRVSNSISISLSSYYQSELKYYDILETQWKIGISLTNIGPKLVYEKGGNEFFIPANLKFGFGYDFLFEKEHSLSLLLEANKLLVPTPPLYGFVDKNNDSKQNSDEPTIIIEGKNPNVSFFDGVFQSFFDAPKGWREELQEISLSLGFEYCFRDNFALRCGYFYEDPNKGARQFLTIGTGFKYQSFRFHFSYLFSITSVPNPLENALRISGSYER